MNADLVRHKNTISVIAIVMLLLAIPSGLWAYGYYVILRWVVTIAALFVFWTAYELKKTEWLWIMGATALLFNPIAPIHIDKGTWVIIDFIAAGLFLISIFKIKRYERKN
jgi:hypothetical protein